MRISVPIKEKSHDRIKKIAEEKQMSASEYAASLIESGLNQTPEPEKSKKITITNHEAWVERKIFEIVILARVILREHIPDNDERLFRYINDSKRHAEERVGKRLEILQGIHSSETQGE